MTIINHHHRFVFVHIPKNAGTSVAQYLSQVSSYRDQEIGATELGEALAPAYRRRFDLHKHSTYAEIEQVVGAELMGSYTTLAVARDPYERTRSTFAFLKGWTGWHGLARFTEQAREFEHQDLESFVGSDFFQTSGPDRLLEPQTSWLTRADSDELLVDRLIRVESLSAGLDSVTTDLSLPKDRLRTSVGRDNRSPRRARARLNDRCRDAIRERYAADFERLGYTP
jgi:hypothetical protein